MKAKILQKHLDHSKDEETKSSGSELGRGDEYRKQSSGSL